MRYEVPAAPLAGRVEQPRRFLGAHRVTPEDLTPGFAGCKVCSISTATVTYAPPKGKERDSAWTSPDFGGLPPELLEWRSRDVDGRAGPTCPRCKMLSNGKLWQGLPLFTRPRRPLGPDPVAKPHNPAMIRDPEGGPPLSSVRTAMLRTENVLRDRPPTPDPDFDPGMLAVTRRAFNIFEANPERPFPDTSIPRHLAAILLRHWRGDFGTVGTIDDKAPAGSLAGLMAPRHVPQRRGDQCEPWRGREPLRWRARAYRRLDGLRTPRPGRHHAGFAFRGRVCPGDVIDPDPVSLGAGIESVSRRSRDGHRYWTTVSADNRCMFAPLLSEANLQLIHSRGRSRESGENPVFRWVSRS